MNRKCKRCNSEMSLTSLESDGGIHTHWICKKDEGHPFFCEQDKHWVGK